MPRVPAEDRRQVEVQVEGVTYRQRDGFFDVPSDRHARAILQSGNYGSSWQTAPPVRRSDGYRCPECGFGSFTKTCGRCGETCERES